MAGTIVTDRIESDASFASKIELASPVLVSNTFAVKSTGGTGTFNIVGANTNTDRTVTLPDVGGNVVLDSATQTLTNKTIDAAQLTGNVAAARITTALNATGDAPVYACRAWVNFNGTNGNIRASGNVSSVSRTGTGVYTVNFATAMPDTNYVVTGMTGRAINSDQRGLFYGGSTTTSVDVANIGSGFYDDPENSVAIFR